MILAGILVWIASLGGVASAQIPNTLRHSLFAPETLPQKFERQGFCVAMDGNLAVIGVPFHDLDDVTGFDCGAVKIHDATTGNLLYMLENPDGAPFGYFGHSVAISGATVVVGSGSPAGGFAYAGRVHVYNLASSNPTVPVLSLDNPDPAAYDLFGHSVAVDGDRLVVGAWLDDAGEINSGSAYVYDLSSATPGVPVETLVNPSPGEDDNFGVAVAISGAKVVVAAYHDDTGAQNAGRVYVYDLQSSSPTEPTMAFGRPQPGVNDGFGNAVAISGTTVAVGAETADTGASNAGSAMVFDLLSATPTEPVVILQNPNPQVNAYFGDSISISGSLVVVGEYRNGAPAANGGACHVFDLTGITPGTVSRTLRKPVPVAADYFGNSVSISGTRILVGASQEDMGDNEAGGSYIFELTSGNPATPVAILSSPMANSIDRFGSAVAISGDILVIGSPGSDFRATGAGLVKVHDLASSKPTTPYFTLENPSPSAGDSFGGAVAVFGMLVAVGAAGDDAGAIDAGSAFIFDLASSNPTVPALTLPNPGPAAGDGFGGAVAISGTILVVGAADDDQGAGNAGRAYVYDLSGSTPGVPVAVLDNPSPAIDDCFGGAVAVSGSHISVGAADDDSTSPNAGTVYVYGVSGQPVLTLENPVPHNGDGFGVALALSGSRLVVGASRDDAGAANAGSAYVYELSSGTPAVPFIVLNAPVPAAEDHFGNSVAVSGSRVVVAASLADGPLDSGRVYSFNLASGTPGIPSASLFKPSSRAAGDLFGASVGVDGAIIVIGTPSDNKTSPDKGAAYVFGPAAPEIAVEGPSGNELIQGDTVGFGAVAMGPGGGGTLSVSILNTGITGLQVSQISVVGGNAAEFSVGMTGVSSTVQAGDDTTFTVTLNPTSPGIRATTLRIVSTDTDENPFEIQLTGQSLSVDNDSDGDGLNDVAELRMAALGFDWQVPDPALVQTFQATASGAGYFGPEQVQSLRIAPPEISRNPASGMVKLTLFLEKASAPSIYEPFPMSAPQTSINFQGELEFLFSVPDDAAFFRLETE